jgi:hypothetical protein
MNDLKDELKDGYNLRLKGLSDTLDPIFIWGAPGIGKTQAVEQLCKDKNLALIVWHLATVEPVDFVGVPSVEKNRTILNLPAIFPVEGDVNTGGILFFDELNRAKESVLSAALQLCNEGEVGSYKLPANWWIVAAGNRDQDEPGRITEMGTALSARFTHYNLVPTVEEWIKWAMENNKLHEDILAFFSIDKNKDEYYHKMDPDAGDVPWPNPRNWVKASIKYSELLGDRGSLPVEKVKRMFSGIIGTEAANMFCEFLKIKEVFNQSDVESVYKDPENAKLIEDDKIDTVYAVMIYIAFYKNNEAVTHSDIDNLLTYAMRYKNTDIGNILVKYFKNAHPCLTNDPELKKYWVNSTTAWSAKYRAAYR